MGRPKGSKNKPKIVDTSVTQPKVKDTSKSLPKVKVTKALIGEVINKPVKTVVSGIPKAVVEVWDTPEEDKAWEHLKDLPAIEEKPEDINDAILKEVTPPKDAIQVGMEPTPKKKLPKGVRDVAEKVEFALQELKDLRDYVRRLEDFFNEYKAARPLSPEEHAESTVKKRHRKA